MQTFKFFIASLLLCFTFCSTAFAQNIVVTTGNPGAWTGDQSAGLNLNAASAAADLAGLGFGLTPVAYTAPCGNINNNPAPQITIPTGACNQNAGTFFYRTTVNLNTCFVGTFQIRADDAFRVFVNGVNVAGTLNLAGCSGSTLTQLNGNTWGGVFTVNVSLNYFVQGANTIDIEVANCTGVSYLGALLTFSPAPAFPAGNQIHYNVTQNGGSYNANLWGVNPKSMKISGYNGLWMGNWVIESGPTTTGPWTPFTSNTENSSTPTTPWVPTAFSYGTYYKVTYTITTTCGTTATYTQIIYICQGCFAGPSDDRDNSEDVVSPLTFEPETVTLLDPSTYINYQDSTTNQIHTSAFVDNSSQTLVITTSENQEDTQFDVFSMEGKLMWTGRYCRENCRVDVSDWKEGVYVVYSRNKNLPVTPKKVVILRE